ncbi:MAG TPA: TonB family protein [Candidatus Desulfobacillus sp.]|nr:TonB family protein [Candidatus Desulfobacillus sp.]
MLLALAASLAIHLLLIALPAGQAGLSAAPLRARLMPPVLPPPAELLLKDTLSASLEGPRAQPRPAHPAGGKTARRAIGQRKEADTLFYPPEALAHRLEGEVRLLLTLDEDGTIREVSLAAGSGHEVLDAAALQAARALGRLPEAGAREVLLPVVFRLR